MGIDRAARVLRDQGELVALAAIEEANLRDLDGLRELPIGVASDPNLGGSARYTVLEPVVPQAPAPLGIPIRRALRPVGPSRRAQLNQQLEVLMDATTRGLQRKLAPPRGHGSFPTLRDYCFLGEHTPPCDAPFYVPVFSSAKYAGATEISRSSTWPTLRSLLFDLVVWLGGRDIRSEQVSTLYPPVEQLQESYERETVLGLTRGTQGYNGDPIERLGYKYWAWRPIYLRVALMALATQDLRAVSILSASGLVETSMGTLATNTVGNICVAQGVDVTRVSHELLQADTVRFVMNTLAFRSIRTNSALPVGAPAVKSF
jgi:hypothetical protein